MVFRFSHRLFCDVLSCIVDHCFLSTEQSLRAKKLGRTMMEQSIYQAHQIQRRASVGLNRNKPVRPAIKNRLGTNSTANLDETNSKRRTRRVSITLPSNKNIDENKRRKDLKLSESDLADHGHGKYMHEVSSTDLVQMRRTEAKSSKITHFSRCYSKLSMGRPKACLNVCVHLCHTAIIASRRLELMCYAAVIRVLFPKKLD